MEGKMFHTAPLLSTSISGKVIFTRIVDENERDVAVVTAQNHVEVAEWIAALMNQAMSEECQNESRPDPAYWFPGEDAKTGPGPGWDGDHEL
jgi:hypothetical protein